MLIKRENFARVSTPQRREEYIRSLMKRIKEAKQSSKRKYRHIRDLLQEVSHCGCLTVMQAVTNEVDASTMRGINLLPESVTALHLAVRYQLPDTVRHLIDVGLNVNAHDDSNEFTPLHDAVRVGNLMIAEILLDRGANVNAEDAMGITPYKSAEIRGFGEMMDLLRSRGAHTRWPDERSHKFNGRYPRGRKYSVISLL